MLPTQDKQAIEDITSYLYSCFGTWEERSYYDLSKVNQDSWQSYTIEIFQKLGKLGYHKGLPSSIDEALNSGDGVYRP